MIFFGQPPYIFNIFHHCLTFDQGGSKQCHRHSHFPTSCKIFLPSFTTGNCGLEFYSFVSPLSNLESRLIFKMLTSNHWAILSLDDLSSVHPIHYTTTYHLLKNIFDWIGSGTLICMYWIKGGIFYKGWHTHTSRLYQALRNYKIYVFVWIQCFFLILPTSI